MCMLIEIYLIEFRRNFIVHYVAKTILYLIVLMLILLLFKVVVDLFSKIPLYSNL